MMLIQQMRGNSSSAMARLHPSQQQATVMKTASGGGLHPIPGQFEHLLNGAKVNRSQFESITHHGPDDPLLFNEMPSIGDNSSVGGGAAFKGG